MGRNSDWRLIIFIIMCFYASSPWPKVQAIGNYTRDSLDSFVYDYAFNGTVRPRTGRLYNVSLPANFSGVEVSVIRLRTSRLWRNGANLSFLEIPPRILPRPFTRRVDIVYQNLGNWSPFYYNVPNYTFVASVLGFLAYDSDTRLMNNRPIEIDLRGENPIIFRFPNVTSFGNGTLKCVRFDNNGTLEFSNVTGGSSCLARNQGHFSIVIPYDDHSKEEKKKGFKWWVVGVVAGAVGLVLFVVLGIVGFKLIKRCRMRRMERSSDRSESLDTIWVGRSRMPSASGIRTQPILENTYVP